MTERDIRANALVIEDGLDKLALADGHDEEAFNEAFGTMLKAGFALVVGLLIDINRIADAAERSRPNLKADADIYRRG